MIQESRFFSGNAQKLLREREIDHDLVEAPHHINDEKSQQFMTIILNSFPDQYHDEINKLKALNIRVFCLAPVGMRKKYREGITSVEVILKEENSGSMRAYVSESAQVEDIDAFKIIFPEVEVDIINQEDLELMCAESIIRPMIISLLTGRMKMDSSRPLMSDLQMQAALTQVDPEIGYARDAIRYNPYSSEAFSDVERKLKEVWNDLSNY